MTGRPNALLANAEGVSCCGREVVDAILGVYHGLFEALEEKMESLIDRDQDAASENRFGIEGSMFQGIIEVFHDNPLVEEAIIYGSRAKGVHKPGSDIDVALKGTELTLQDLNRISLALPWTTCSCRIPLTFHFSTTSTMKNCLLILDGLGNVFFAGKVKVREREWRCGGVFWN